MTINDSLSVLFVGMYNRSKQEGRTFIPDFEVAKKVMLGLYNSFVSEKIIVPIEELTEEVKLDLVKECREVENHNYTNETLIEASKILHLVKVINSYT